MSTKTSKESLNPYKKDNNQHALNKYNNIYLVNWNGIIHLLAETLPDCTLQGDPTLLHCTLDGDPTLLHCILDTEPPSYFFDCQTSNFDSWQRKTKLMYLTIGAMALLNRL